MTPSSPPSDSSPTGTRFWTRIWRFEPLFVFLFLVVYAGQLAPGVNEAHYLSKAKHYWNPEWCPHDQFMNSADTHLAFYWTFGWLTQFCSLAMTAWIGRWGVWALLSWGWLRLVRSVCEVPGTAVLSLALATALAELTNMAGEWCVGGVEGKVVAWAFVFAASGCVIRDRWLLVWPFLGVAVAFHALVGGWAGLICGGLWLWTRRETSASQWWREVWRMGPSLFVGAAAAVLGLLPAILMDWYTEPEVLRTAHRIQVDERLAHHLRLSGMRWYRHLRFGLLIAAWWSIAHVPLSPTLRRLRAIVNGSLLISLVGACIEIVGGATGVSMASLQRFYWFRMSDVFVPVGFVLVAMVRVIEFPQVSATARHRVLTIALILLVVWIPTRFIYLRLDRRPHAVRQARPFRFRSRRRIQARYQDWRAVCDWVQQHTPTDATFITPPTRQTFKWFADRGELATWKGMPQDAASIVEWKKRRLALEASGLYDAEMPIDWGRIQQLSREFGLTHLIVEQPVPLGDTLPLIYRNDHFQVYRLPSAQRSHAANSAPPLTRGPPSA